jgi:hypothetical protein
MEPGVSRRAFVDSRARRTSDSFYDLGDAAVVKPNKRRSRYQPYPMCSPGPAPRSFGVDGDLQIIMESSPPLPHVSAPGPTPPTDKGRMSFRANVFIPYDHEQRSQRRATAKTTPPREEIGTYLQGEITLVSAASSDMSSPDDNVAEGGEEYDLNTPLSAQSGSTNVPYEFHESTPSAPATYVTYPESPTLVQV